MAFRDQCPELTDEMLPRCAPQRLDDPAAKRVRAVLQAVVRIAARDEPAIANERSAQRRCSRIVAHGAVLEINDVVPGSNQPEADIGFIQVVAKVLVEPSDCQERRPPERAVVPHGPAVPACLILFGRELLACENLFRVVGGPSTGELSPLGVAVDRCSSGCSDPALAIALEDVHELTQPLRISGQRIVVYEDHHVARRRRDADVPRARQVRRRAPGNLQPIGMTRQHHIRVVRGRPVHDDDFEAHTVEMVQ